MAKGYEFNEYGKPQLGSRRDLLELFGIGATIVPIVGGEPKGRSLTATLKEPAKVRKSWRRGRCKGRRRSRKEYTVTVNIAGDDGRAYRVRMRSTLAAPELSCRNMPRSPSPD